MSKVLITGGSGFIGSHTADLLEERGFQVRVLDSLDSNLYFNGLPDWCKKDRREFIQGDVTKKEDLKRAIEGVDYIFHLAAHQDQLPNYSRFYDTNTKSTALILELLNEEKHKVKKIIYASSQFVYGDGYYKDKFSDNLYRANLRLEEDLQRSRWDVMSDGEKLVFVPFEESQKTNPPNAYALSKVASEEMLRVIGEKIGIPNSIVRYSIVQGPRQSPKNVYSGAMRIFVCQALNGIPITVYEDGEQTRDFVNVEDVARANVLLMESDKSDYQLYNIGGSKAYKLGEFAQAVKEITGSNSDIVFGNYRRTDTRHAVSNIDKIRSLGWNPDYGIEKSIEDYVRWIKDNKIDISSVIGAQEELRRLGVTGR
jgi:dTDP-L-rhamnose 4-epimerase